MGDFPALIIGAFVWYYTGSFEQAFWVYATMALIDLRQRVARLEKERDVGQRAVTHY
jgi:hypothetical protein